MIPIFSNLDLNKSEYLAFTRVSRVTPLVVRTHGGAGIGTWTLLLRGGPDRCRIASSGSSLRGLLVGCLISAWNSVD